MSEENQNQGSAERERLGQGSVEMERLGQGSVGMERLGQGSVEMERLEGERLKQENGERESQEQGSVGQREQGQKMKIRREALKERQAKDAEQRKRLREFDRELFSYTGQIAWLVPGIFSFAVLGLMCIPVQEIRSEDNYLGVMAFMVCVLLPYFILLPYINITDAFERPKNNRNMTYDKLKYLPVSRKQYILVRMGYLFRYMWKLALAGGAVQCIFAIGEMGRVELVNIAYAAGVLLLMPLAVGWIQMKVFAGGS